MRVSAVVPTFNRAHLLPRALDSILTQSYPDIEVVVVDDGSTDATAEMIKKYQGGKRPVRYIQKANGGCASARNRGVAEASGELIAFLDSDDEWLPNAIESMVAVLEKSGADFVYSPNIEQVTPEIRFVTPPAAPGRPQDFAVEHFLTSRARPCSQVYRRRVFEKVGFNEKARFNEDTEFLQRVAVSFRSEYFDQPTGVVHHHANNKSKNQVEIARAVLKSSEAVLRDFPDFRNVLGAKAEQRCNDLRRELVEALLVEGRIEEARQETGGLHFGVQLDLWLQLGWSLPLRVRRQLHQVRFFAQRALWRLKRAR